MSARSLNKVMIIGNLTRDPELRYTPQGTPVCTIGVATNRSWVDSNNKQQEETEYHRAVAWSKLAELCHQLLFKGRKVYLEGRLQTRRWTAQSGEERQTTEIVVDEMIVLDSKRREENESNYQEDYRDDSNASADVSTGTGAQTPPASSDVTMPADDSSQGSVDIGSKDKKQAADTQVPAKADTGKKAEDKADTNEVGADDINI